MLTTDLKYLAICQVPVARLYSRARMQGQFLTPSGKGCYTSLTIEGSFYAVQAVQSGQPLWGSLLQLRRHRARIETSLLASLRNAAAREGGGSGSET